MSDCRLPQLPDRSPVKLTVTVMPDQHQKLADYAAFYRDSYGREEAVTDLIPAMLQAFIESDRAFMRRKAAS